MNKPGISSTFSPPVIPSINPLSFLSQNSGSEIPVVASVAGGICVGVLYCLFFRGSAAKRVGTSQFSRAASPLAKIPRGGSHESNPRAYPAGYAGQNRWHDKCRPLYSSLHIWKASIPVQKRFPVQDWLGSEMAYPVKDSRPSKPYATHLSSTYTFRPNKGVLPPGLSSCYFFSPVYREWYRNRLRQLLTLINQGWWGWSDRTISFFTRCSFIIVNVFTRKRMSQHSLNENIVTFSANSVYLCFQTRAYDYLNIFFRFQC